MSGKRDSHRTRLTKKLLKLEKEKGRRNPSEQERQLKALKLNILQGEVQSLRARLERVTITPKALAEALRIASEQVAKDPTRGAVEATEADYEGPRKA